jgi:hypothetical protein
MTASHLTLTADTLNGLPSGTQDELLAWLRAADLDPAKVSRITLPGGEGVRAAFVTEPELDGSSPFVGHIRMLAPGRVLALPEHLRRWFQPTDDLI